MIIYKLDETAAKNGYYGSLVSMVRDAFICCELVRIDCQGLEKSDYKKIGCKLRVNFQAFLSFSAEACFMYNSNFYCSHVQ